MCDGMVLLVQILKMNAYQILKYLLKNKYPLRGRGLLRIKRKRQCSRKKVTTAKPTNQKEKSTKCYLVEIHNNDALYTGKKNKGFCKALW